MVQNRLFSNSLSVALQSVRAAANADEPYPNGIDALAFISVSTARRKSVCKSVLN